MRKFAQFQMNLNQHLLIFGNILVSLLLMQQNRESVAGPGQAGTDAADSLSRRFEGESFIRGSARLGDGACQYRRRALLHWPAEWVPRPSVGPGVGGNRTGPGSGEAEAEARRRRF